MKRSGRRVRFAAKTEVFAVPPPAPDALPAPVAGRAQKRPHEQRKVRVTGRAAARERSTINKARSAHAFETAFAAKERDTAEAVMRLLWKMKGSSEWCQTGAAAVAEDAERADAATAVEALLAEIAKPSDNEGRLSVKDVEAVLQSKDSVISAC